MYVALLQDSRFYQFLFHVDRDLAEQTRRSGCLFCGAPLHSANYRRRPRGLPEGIDPGPEFGLCHSFCCSADGCRRRHRAPSVRFLGRKVYLAAMVALLTAMRQGPTPRSAQQLKMHFGADRSTLARWRLWWERVFPRSEFWQRLRGLVPPFIRERELPCSLIAQFAGNTLLQRVLGMLRLLSRLFTVFDGRGRPAKDARGAGDDRCRRLPQSWGCSQFV